MVSKNPRQRLDAAWVIALLADIADEILDERTMTMLLDATPRQQLARLVLSRVHDVHALDPGALPNCKRCGNSGAVDVEGFHDGAYVTRTVACDCGHPMVPPPGDDWRVLREAADAMPVGSDASISTLAELKCRARLRERADAIEAQHGSAPKGEPVWTQEEIDAAREKAKEWALMLDDDSVAAPRTPLDEALESVRDHVMTPEEREEQRRSFAFGNAHMSNPHVTREMVDAAAESRTPSPVEGEPNGECYVHAFSSGVCSRGMSCIVDHAGIALMSEVFGEPPKVPSCTCPGRDLNGNLVDPRGCPVHEPTSAAEDPVAEHYASDETGRWYCELCEERLTPPGEPIIHASDCVIALLQGSVAELSRVREEQDANVRAADIMADSCSQAIARAERAEAERDELRRVCTEIAEVTGYVHEADGHASQPCEPAELPQLLARDARARDSYRDKLATDVRRRDLLLARAAVFLSEYALNSSEFDPLRTLLADIAAVGGDA